MYRSELKSSGKLVDKFKRNLGNAQLTAVIDGDIFLFHKNVAVFTQCCWRDGSQEQRFLLRRACSRLTLVSTVEITSFVMKSRHFLFVGGWGRGGEELLIVSKFTVTTMQPTQRTSLPGGAVTGESHDTLCNAAVIGGQQNTQRHSTLSVIRSGRIRSNRSAHAGRREPMHWRVPSGYLHPLRARVVSMCRGQTLPSGASGAGDGVSLNPARLASSPARSGSTGPRFGSARFASAPHDSLDASGLDLGCSHCAGVEQRRSLLYVRGVAKWGWRGGWRDMA